MKDWLRDVIQGRE